MRFLAYEHTPIVAIVLQIFTCTAKPYRHNYRITQKNVRPAHKLALDQGEFFHELAAYW